LKVGPTELAYTLNIAGHYEEASAAERQERAPAFIAERPMPQYFFHFDDTTALEDDPGANLPDMAALQRYAMQVAGGILRDGGSPQLWSGVPWTMWVKDNEGRSILTLRFSAEQHEG